MLFVLYSYYACFGTLGAARDAEGAIDEDKARAVPSPDVSLSPRVKRGIVGERAPAQAHGVGGA